MANIQVQKVIGSGPRPVKLTIQLGRHGVGLQLAEEDDRLVVRGYREFPDGSTNPGKVKKSHARFEVALI